MDDAMVVLSQGVRDEYDRSSEIQIRHQNATGCTRSVFKVHRPRTRHVVHNIDNEVPIHSGDAMWTMASRKIATRKLASLMRHLYANKYLAQVPGNMEREG